MIASFSTILWTTISYPAHLATTWFFTKTGLYAFSRALFARAHALKEKDKKTTNMMKADALRRKMEENAGVMRERIQKLKMKSLFQEEDVELKDGTRRRGTLSEIEMGQSNRSGSGSLLHFSPRV